MSCTGSISKLIVQKLPCLKFSNRPKEFGKVLGLLFLMIIFSTFSRIQLKPPLFILSLSVFFNSIRPLFTSRFAKKSYNHHHYQRIRFKINVICNSIFLTSVIFANCILNFVQKGYGRCYFIEDLITFG